MTTKRDFGGCIFDVPEYVIYRGRKYNEAPSYTLHSDVAKKWAKNGNRVINKYIVKKIKSREKKSVFLYQLYKKILSESESTEYYKKLAGEEVQYHKKTGKWKPVSID